MCNLYDLGPAPGRVRFDWEQGLLDLLDGMSYVAPGRPGLAARGTGRQWEAVVMRWGFHRAWSPAITNARDDKLDGRTWAEAWLLRRCVLPVRRFYEWSGTPGRKTKLTIRTEDDDAWFWFGGLWEEHPEPAIGLSYALITTVASPQLASFHGRMPLILAPGDLEAFVFGNSPPLALLRPYPGVLDVQASPVPAQQAPELF